jgi:hypothetical protein
MVPKPNHGTPQRHGQEADRNARWKVRGIGGKRLTYKDSVSQSRSLQTIFSRPDAAQSWLCRSVVGRRSRIADQWLANALTLARAHLNATCHVICLSDNFSVAKALPNGRLSAVESPKQAAISETLSICGQRYRFRDLRPPDRSMFVESQIREFDAWHA